MAFLATLTPTKSQPYVAQGGNITVPCGGRDRCSGDGHIPAAGGNGFERARASFGKPWARSPLTARTSPSHRPITGRCGWKPKPNGRMDAARLRPPIRQPRTAFPTFPLWPQTPPPSRSTQNPAMWTFTRTGDTSTDLTVYFGLAGTATMWNDYYRLPQGDMPQQLTIPAGSTTATLTVYVNPISTISASETAILSVSQNAAYNVGNPSSATITLNP